jgi:hypothetical protein
MSRLRSVEQLVDESATASGLDDFGPGAWRDGLDVLVDAANTEAELNDVGVAILEGRIANTLRQRLEVHDWLRRHPEILDVPVEGPAIVVGLPRTGTTALSNLLGCDPDTRALRVWESATPCPPPESATVGSDPRIAAAQAGIDILHEMKPIMRVLHDDDAYSVAESFDLLALSFRAHQYEGMARMPSFFEWWVAADLTAAYELHRRVIQLLGWHCPPARWHLRNPSDIFRFETVLDAYPDARFVWCHRDPAAVFASLCELIAEVRLMGADAVDRTEIGREQLRQWSLAMDRGLEARARLGDERFVDVWHHEVIADPVATLASTYKGIGWEFTDRAGGAAATWLADHDRTAHGEHHPQLADYGLDAQQVRDRLAGYCELFGI